MIHYNLTVDKRAWKWGAIGAVKVKCSLLNEPGLAYYYTHQLPFADVSNFVLHSSLVGQYEKEKGCVRDKLNRPDLRDRFFRDTKEAHLPTSLPWKSLLWGPIGDTHFLFTCNHV